MKKFKHVVVVSGRYKNDMSIFKLSRDVVETNAHYTIEGSKFDKQWTPKGLRPMVQFNDDGNGVLVSIREGVFGTLDYAQLEELRLLLNYYAEHTNSREINSRIRSKR